MTSGCPRFNHLPPQSCDTGPLGMLLSHPRVFLNRELKNLDKAGTVRRTLGSSLPTADVSVSPAPPPTSAASVYPLFSPSPHHLIPPLAPPIQLENFLSCFTCFKFSE